MGQSTKHICLYYFLSTTRTEETEALRTIIQPDSTPILPPSVPPSVPQYYLHQYLHQYPSHTQPFSWLLTAQPQELKDYTCGFSYFSMLVYHLNY